jgi:hypothetical protein
MIITVLHRRRLCLSKPSSVRCGMNQVILFGILILTVSCVSSMPTTGLGAHCFHSYSKPLQPCGRRRCRLGNDTSSGAGASLRRKHAAAASYLSIRGGSFDLPHTEVTVFGAQTSVDYCGRGYVVSMYTTEELARGGSTDTAGSRRIPPFISSNSRKATSLVPSEPSADDDVILPSLLHRLLGEWSFLFLIIPIIILKLILI